MTALHACSNWYTRPVFTIKTIYAKLGVVKIHIMGSYNHMEKLTVNDIMQRIARNTRQQRVSKSLTQEAVAASADLAVRHYQKIEAGEVNVTVYTLIKLANALEVDITELLHP